jgi:DNA-binding MarR family transcriptional regulator
LEAKGLVRRARQNDRRIIHIHLTSQGEELTAILPDPLETRIDRALRDIPEPELQAFALPISRLLQSFGALPAQDGPLEQAALSQEQEGHAPSS